MKNNGEATKFKPGHAKIPGSGRAKGQRNRLSLAVLNDLYQVWMEEAQGVPLADNPTNGVAALRIIAKEETAKFVQIYAGLLPKEIEVTDNVADMPDERINAVLAYVESQIAELTGADGDAGETGERKDETRSLN